MRDWLLYNHGASGRADAARVVLPAIMRIMFQNFMFWASSGVCLVMGLLLLRRYQYVLLNI